MTTLRYGHAAPDFALPSTDGGRTIALEEFRGKQDVVLAFYCYDWGSI